MVELVPGFNKPAFGKELVRALPVFRGAMHFHVKIQNKGVFGRDSSLVTLVIYYFLIRLAGTAAARRSEKSHCLFDGSSGVWQGVGEMRLFLEH